MWQNNIRFVTQNVEPNSVLLPDGLTYSEKILSLGPLQVIPVTPATVSGSVAQDISGNGRNGAVSNITLDAIDPPIAGAGRAALWNGTTSYVNLYSASLSNAFNGDEYTLCCWFKAANAGIWTDGVQRMILDVRGINDAINFASIFKPTTNNTISFFDRSNSVTKQIQYVTSTTSWLCVGCTKSLTGDFFKAYVNGSQTGATQTGVGNWSNTTLNPDIVKLGAYSITPTFVANGYVWMSMIFARALTDIEMATLANNGFFLT